MKKIKEISFNDLNELTKDCVWAQYSFDKLEQSEIDEINENLKATTFELLEYDPKEAEDLETLKSHLKDKISEEGQPDQAQVDEIGRSGKIDEPILIEDGTCMEGRHRLQAAINYNLKIKALCW